MKTNLKVYTLTGAGTEIANFSVADTYEKYIIKGSATSIGNYAISITGTPQAGETFIVKYKGVLDITTNGNTFSILGQSLTQNQLISDLDIEAYYDGSAWIVEIKPSFTSSVVENAQVVSATLANSKLAQMAAYTIKANNTGSSAVPQDVDACTLVTACAWGLSGNAGTDSSTDILGTTDGEDLIVQGGTIYFKAGGDFSGKVGGVNTSLGYSALLNTTNNAFNNTAFGYESLLNLTTGDSNTAVGFSSLVNTVGGSENTAIGESAALINTSGNYNTAVGFASLYNNSTGVNNTAVGHQAGYNITGNRNTMIGVDSTSSIAGANNRIALGYGAEADADFQFALPDNVTKVKWRGVTYTLPSADGTAGQALKTMGDGTLYWG